MGVDLAASDVATSREVLVGEFAEKHTRNRVRGLIRAHLVFGFYGYTQQVTCYWRPYWQAFSHQYGPPRHHTPDTSPLTRLGEGWMDEGREGMDELFPTTNGAFLFLPVYRFRCHFILEFALILILTSQNSTHPHPHFPTPSPHLRDVEAGEHRQVANHPGDGDCAVCANVVATVIVCVCARALMRE
jgi:hypothetical protein